MLQAIKDELLKQEIMIESDEEIVNYFNGNFKNVLTFCKEHNIEIVIDDQEKKLLDTFVKSNRLKFKGTIDSLDDIILVHKTTGIPNNDKIAPASEQEYDEVLDYRGNYSPKRTVSVVVNGEEKSTVIEVPTAHSTTHFCMNAEVRAHGTSSWDHCDVIVMQPFTEKLYESAIGTDPADTFFGDEIDLEEHIIICKDKEKYEQAKKKNPKAIVIHLPKWEIKFGDKICEAMGFEQFYGFYGGLAYGYDDKYSEELLTTYPKLKTNSHAFTDSFVSHEASGVFQNLMCDVTEFRLFESEMQSKETFDYIISEFRKTEKKFGSGASFITPPFVKDTREFPDQYTYSWEKHIPEGYKHIGKLMDSIRTMDPLEPEAIWQLITEDVEITEENKIPLIRLKSMCLKSVNEYNRKFYDKVENATKVAATVGIDITEEEAKKRAFSHEDYYELSYGLMLYSEVAHNKSMLKRQVESDFEKIELEVEDYDYSKFLEKGKELGVITDPMTIMNFMAENQKEIVERTSLKESEEEKEILEFIQKKKKSSPKSAEETNEFFKKYLEEKGLECDEETLDYLSSIELAPNIDRRQALGYQLLYIQNNTKKKEQEIQQQDLNERTINPTIEIASEKNQVMNKFNKIEDQKQKEKREQIEELQKLKQEVEIAKQQKMQQEIINSQTVNGFVEDDSEIIGFSK